MSGANKEGVELEEGDCVEDLAILGNDDDLVGFAKEKQDSHPTKEKVKAFKNRVFSLVMLFVEKAKNVSPLTDVLDQETFMKEP